MSDTEFQRSAITGTRSYSIQDETENERVPILPSAYRTRETHFQLLDKLFLLALIFILTVGVLIGVYLLLTEGHEWRVPGIYNISSHQLPKSHTTKSPQRPAIPKVLFFQTNHTSSCNHNSLCVELKYIIQTKQTNNMYNFIVNADGNIFVGGGWEMQTFPISRYNVITMGFSGRFNSHVNFEFLHAVTSFISSAIFEKNIASCIDIEVCSENRFFITFAQNIQDSLPTCQDNT